MAIFRWGPPNGGVGCRCGRQKSRFSTNIDSYRAMAAAVQTATATVDRAVYRHASVNLSQPAWTTTTKRRKQNLNVRSSGKSEAGVTNNRRVFPVTSHQSNTPSRSLAAPLVKAHNKLPILVA